MERWIDGEPVPVALPGGGEPKTVWHILQMNDEEAGILEGSLQALREAAQKASRNINDPDHLRKEAEQDRAGIAERITKVENVIEAGDEITDKGEIRDRLHKLAAGRYRALRQIITGVADITVFERK